MTILQPGQLSDRSDGRLIPLQTVLIWMPVFTLVEDLLVQFPKNRPVFIPPQWQCPFAVFRRPHRL